jgi:hypothetical protein
MKIFKYSLYSFSVFILLNCQSINAQSSTSLDDLKKQVNLLQEKIELIEKTQKENVKPDAVISPNQNNKQSAKKNSLRFYATLRPSFGHIDENGESFWDVRDALSHAGIRATNSFSKDWSAVLHGEWGMDLSNNGDFGKARQVYVALNSPVGSIGIGKQRPVQYLFIAEYTDIFNHSNSPFAYDAESIFFVDNLVTYKLKTGDFSWMLASQFNGTDGDNNSDLTNIGISYDKDSFHTAFTYLTQDNNTDGIKEGEDEVFAGALAYTFSNTLYVALAYQDRQYQIDSDPNDRHGHTLDLSAAYNLANNFKVKLGLFDFSDGYKTAQSQDFNGYNTTLEWMPNSSLRFHIEYLHRNFEYLDDFSSISIGFRYDLSSEVKY